MHPGRWRHRDYDGLSRALPARRQSSSVAAANSVKIVGDQLAADYKGFRPRLLAMALLLDLKWAFMGLPVTGDTIQDLMRAFAASANS